jgi:alkanesulfonate monooxygenase SsuD/methylene tetrahydromethanopterin reductase-like flavin-dependent oxidoreductase (luciferase family)
VGLAATAADVPDVTALTERRFKGWGGLITGTAADVAQTLTGLRDRGVERFYLQFSDFGTPDTLARFGADVIPLVQTAAPAREH